MVSIKVLGVKGLAAASVGLFSLAICAPTSASGATSTNLAITSTPTFTTGGEAVIIPSAQSNVFSWDPTDSDNDLLESPSQIPDSKVPDKDKDFAELQRVAKLYGITTAQLAGAQLEKTDSELAEPANNMALNKTESELAEPADDMMSPGKIISGLANTLGLNILPFEPTEVSNSAIELKETTDERMNKSHLKWRQAKRGFRVGLVNGTPYIWKRIGISFSHINRDFPNVFREVILPGEPLSGKVWTNNKQAQATVKYELEGTLEKTWFTVHISAGRPHQVTVEYGGALETVASGNEGKRGSMVDLGVQRGVFCATFYLTGSEGRFLSNDAPANWMNTMLDEIGNYTLRDVMLPRSHHAGMYTLDRVMGFGTRDNTFTQDFSVYEQLKVSGVRVIDSRPVLKRKSKKVFESHGSKIAGLYHGTLGVSHDSMIDQINRFNDEYPGELIIIDVDGQEMRGDKRFNQLPAAGVAHIVESFKRLKHRAVLVPGEDIAQIPLHRFIGDGQSAVVIRMEEYRIRDLPGDGYPGATQGFITNNELPYHKHWSEMNKVDKMVEDQTSKLIDYKDGNFRQLYVSDFLLTQMGIDLLVGPSIRSLNEKAWEALITTFWGVFRQGVFPNWLAMDSIRGSELRGIAMTVNECLAAKRCGKMGDRAPDAKDFKLEQATIRNGTVTQSDEINH